MKPNRLYRVTLNEMPAQETRGGKIKLDAEGNPLKSVQVRQSPEQKREMLDWMLHLAKLYQHHPELFPEGRHQVGNDPKKYTVAEMMEDFLERADTWRMLSSAHIYKSFIDRHNWMVDTVVERVHSEGLLDEVEYIMKNYYIRFWTSRQEQMQEAIRKTGLWKTG